MSRNLQLLQPQQDTKSNLLPILLSLSLSLSFPYFMPSINRLVQGLELDLAFFPDAYQTSLHTVKHSESLKFVCVCIKQVNARRNLNILTISKINV